MAMCMVKADITTEFDSTGLQYTKPAQAGFVLSGTWLGAGKFDASDVVSLVVTGILLKCIVKCLLK